MLTTYYNEEVPNSLQITQRELSVNLTHRAIYAKNLANEVVKVVDWREVDDIKNEIDSIINTTTSLEEDIVAIRADLLDNYATIEEYFEEIIGNGKWTATKFPGGTLICTYSHTISSLPINIATGSIFVSDPRAPRTFLIPFSSKPITTISIHGGVTGSGSDNNFIVTYIDNYTDNVLTQFPICRVAGQAEKTITDSTIDYIAIGRWK